MLSQQLGKAIKSVMNEKGLWEDELEPEIPKKWEKYGDLVLFPEKFFCSDKWTEAGNDLWYAVSSVLKVERIAIKGRIQSDNFRTPNVKLVFGNPGLVHYLDNGIKYSWDVEKNMFCPGNVNERHRIAKLNCKGLVVVDLFAGIGYFTLPYLVHACAKFVHACDWNSGAILALRRNLKINKVEERCKIYEGDCREVCPESVGDVVNLGLVPSSEVGWEVGCRALNQERGGVLMVHQNVTSGLTNPPVPVCVLCPQPPSSIPPLYRKQEWFLFALHLTHTISSLLFKLHKKKWDVSVEEVHRVKSYAPHIDHLVFVVKCKAENCINLQPLT